VGSNPTPSASFLDTGPFRTNVIQVLLKMPDAARPKRLLILPAEVYAREFDARLLQGVIAVERGWTVIVGSKALINRSIWRFPPSVYLCQTLTHKRRTMLRLLHWLGHVSFGWDEEGLVYFDRDVYLMRRVSSDTLAFLQRVFTWGLQSAEDVNHRAREQGIVALPLGNPRMDMVRNELHGLYATEIAGIKARFGGFVLIDTNFSSFNPIVSLHDLKPRLVSKKNTPMAGEQDEFRNRQAHRKVIYEHFLSELPRFTAMHPETKFVLRAHPAEDETTWKQRFVGQPNVSVIREGSSVPWLIAADALIHNGCTTAVEAAIIGHTPIAYCPVLSIGEESALPNPISHRVSNFMELHGAIQAAKNGTLVMGGTQTEILRHFVAATDGPLASHKIMDHLDGLHPNRKMSTTMARPFIRLFGFLRNQYKNRRKSHISDRYLEKVFPVVALASIQARANDIAAVLGSDCKIIVTEISSNIFEIAAATKPL
jgi:surface carbohydrate biosynthesis protein